MEIRGQIVDIDRREIYGGIVEVAEDRIVSIRRCADVVGGGYIMPGFVDAHVHIESSMLLPREFGRMVARCGTIAVVSDPHEIANVMGVEGVEFMLEDAQRSEVKIFFTIPSCVPATPFDSAGGVVGTEDVARLVSSGHFVGLSEMMNVPGVLCGDEGVMAKLSAAKEASLPIDGHAPALRGAGLVDYVANGISTDHEAFDLDEAREKLECGVKIIIREGSAARNYDALSPLLSHSADRLMFCMDDAHPDDIVERGHIDSMVRRAVADGYDLFDVLRVASRNVVEHYSLDVGQLRVGDIADFIVVEDLKEFKLCDMYINGKRRSEVVDEPEVQCDSEVNRFNHEMIEEGALRLELAKEMPIIELVEGELVTLEGRYVSDGIESNFESSVDEDILKIVYINRYENGTPQVALCRGFGLQRGAIASSVAHDSHNIIAVGCSDRELMMAINAVISSRGGLAVVDGVDSEVEILSLPIAGIMTNRRFSCVAEDYRELSRLVRDMGSTLKAPFMTLSFLSLVVIPEIKIGERGLFSFSKFDWLS